jgi:hypothetical protein
MWGTNLVIRHYKMKIHSKAVRMASVDDYQRYAEQCVALALKSTNPADKARLLQMAQAWRDLAEKLDTGDRTEDQPK